MLANGNVRRKPERKLEGFGLSIVASHCTSGTGARDRSGGVHVGNGRY